MGAARPNQPPPFALGRWNTSKVATRRSAEPAAPNVARLRSRESGPILPRAPARATGNSREKAKLGLAVPAPLPAFALTSNCAVYGPAERGGASPATGGRLTPALG